MASVPRSERKFDLVVFGATGFCGKLGALYIADKYGAKLKWAIAGRSQAKLEQVRQECKGLPEILIADTSDEEAVKAAVGQTKVIITTAGPYERYGSPIVKACAELGTDYCDITGEADWVREMIALYDDKARNTGARIVHFTGHDCVPWDLMTLMLTKKLKEQGEDLKRIDMYDDLSSGVAGGTIETAFASIGVAKPKKILDYDPVMKAGEAASLSKTKIQNVSSVTKGEDGQPYRSVFFMAGINALCVRRSNALLKYGDEVTYCEGLAKTGCVGAYCTFFGLGLFGCAMSCPPTACCIRKYCLPAPGGGPTKEQLTAGYLTVTGVAKGVRGSKVEATMKFTNEDPGTQATMRMCVESALVFLLEEDFKSPGGSFTPASCQGETLFKRLIATGTTFSFNDKVAAK